VSKAGKRLLRAADEMLAIARGEAEPARIHVPPDVDVKAVRRKLGLSGSVRVGILLLDYPDQGLGAGPQPSARQQQGVPVADRPSS